MPADPTPTADHPDETPARVPLPPTAAHHAREGAGTVVAGRYKLLECVGEGGMGAVWSAQQTAPVKRFVAVKLIKAGTDSKGVLARFEAERQALAVMDHPNIAKILDGGVTDSGSPFFVMELVKGVPITHYCDARKLTPAQRLELFVPVCEAIQHAHQKGVIHRDIKPSNVLVALQDGRPVPKVIDFGIAKATGAALTDLTLNTGVGGIVGTPQYMSPEQASLTGLDIDTRSDVYSLGVLLYELLAGSPPFKRHDLEKAGLLEILRVVRDEEPPKPSTKLSTADACASLSASRGTEPKALNGLLRRELDWVVMKALEKDRNRRYDTPTSFAADIRRYLSGEAVQAHPPSVAYKLRKFARKHRGRLVTATVVGLALGTGSFVGLAGVSLALVVYLEDRAEGNHRLINTARVTRQGGWRDNSPKWSAAQWYDFACLHAMMGQGTEDNARFVISMVIDLLHIALDKAAATSVTDAESMVADIRINPELYWVRNEPEFRDFLEELTAKYPPRELAPPPRPVK